MYSCRRRNNNRNARAQLEFCPDLVRARVMIKTGKPSRWPQSRGYGRHLLKNPQSELQQSKAHAKTKTHQRFGRARQLAPMLEGRTAKKPKKKGNSKPYKLTVA